MIAIGIVSAYLLTEYRARKYRLAYEHVFYIVIWGLAGGFAGSKILYWLTEWQRIAQDPGFILDTIGDGFVVFGGILGGILAGYLYAKIKKLDFLTYLDLVMPSLALAQGFGRIGCLLAGCCYGKETDSLWSITFTESDFAPNHVALVPTQIYSSVLDFLLFFLLLIVAKHKKADGQVAAVYLLCYSIGRFILEFFRGDLERGSVGMLSTSQFIAVFTAAAGAVLLVFTMSGGRLKRKE